MCKFNNYKYLPEHSAFWRLDFPLISYNKKNCCTASVLLAGNWTQNTHLSSAEKGKKN